MQYTSMPIGDQFQKGGTKPSVFIFEYIHRKYPHFFISHRFIIHMILYELAQERLLIIPFPCAGRIRPIESIGDVACLAVIQPLGLSITEHRDTTLLLGLLRPFCPCDP
jgi:hypothetical protein